MRAVYKIHPAACRNRLRVSFLCARKFNWIYRRSIYSAEGGWYSWLSHAPVAFIIIWRRQNSWTPTEDEDNSLRSTWTQYIIIMKSPSRILYQLFKNLSLLFDDYYKLIFWLKHVNRKNKRHPQPQTIYPYLKPTWQFK